MIRLKKFFQKIGAAVVATAVGMTCLVPVAFAEDSTDIEAAILSVKSRIEIPESLTEFSSNVIRRTEGRAEYSLEWSSEIGDESLYITINDKNDITDYNHYISDNDKDERLKFSKYTNEQILDIAMEWLGTVNPTWIAELPRDKADTPYADIYASRGRSRVALTRYVNGIPFLNNNISITIDRSGNITHMYSSWDYEEDIPQVSEAMDKDAAAEEFFKLSAPELKYMKIGEDNTAVLVYEPKNPSLQVNARSGGEIGKRNYYSSKNAYATEDAASEMMAGGSSSRAAVLTEKEMLNLEEINSLLTREELEAKARGLYNTGLDKAELESCEYSRKKAVVYKAAGADKEKESYSARLTFVFNKGTEKQSDATVVFDAQSGELLNYYSYEYYDYIDSYAKDEKSTEPKVSYDAASDTAEKFIAQNAPNEAAKVKTVEEAKPSPREYMLNFIRHENDVPFYDDGINVRINSETGRVMSYNKNWTEDIVFESMDGILDEAGAKKAFSDNIGFELSYVYSYPAAENDEEKMVDPVVELAYTLSGKNTYTINAKTGEAILLYEEKPIVHPDDIDGHYAEKQINALIDIGMLDMNGETSFRPDDAVTHKELAVMVGRLVRGYISVYEDASELARRCGIISRNENFEPDTAAERADGPMYIVRALGYREVAELKDTFKCDFADSDLISAEKLGYVSIAKGFGIVGGDENGCFNPSDMLTRADAAIMIYNYMAR